MNKDFLSYLCVAKRYTFVALLQVVMFICGKKYNFVASVNFYIMRIKLFILFLGLFSCKILCAGERLYFDHYGTKEGLCCDFVLGVGQDSKGFIWVATQDGVSRFDGSYFKNYSKNRGGLLRNDVSCITNTSTGEFLLGGDNGLLQSYEASADTFLDKRFPELMGKYVKSVTGFSQLQDGTLLLLTTSGVFLYDTLKNGFVKDSLLSVFTTPLFVKSFYQDKLGNYWVGTFDGLHIFSVQGKEKKSYGLSKDKAPASSILELDSTHVLVSTNMGGVWLFDLSRQEEPTCEELNTPFKNISVMLKDSKNRIWFGTWGYGLWRMDQLGKFVEIKTYGEENDLKKIHALFEDSDHSVWVGTQINGLFRYQSEDNSKVLHSSMMGFPNVDASCFIERPDGNLYVGSDGTGAYLVTDEGRFVQPMKSFSGLGGSILSFCRWKEDTSLVSSWFGGIGKVSADGTVTSIQYGGLTNTVNSSKCVRFMKDGEIWVATQGDGVYVRRTDGSWEKRKFNVSNEIEDKWVEDMEENQDGTKWVISPFNVWYCDGTDKRISTWQTDPDASEPCILMDGACDEEGNLYVATVCGVLRVSKETGEMNRLDYLPEANYVSAHFDKQGFLWCDGTAGICRVNLKKQTFRRVPLPVDKYGKLFFQPRAIYESSKDNMFFGCSNGFIVMNAKDIDSIRSVKSLMWSRIVGKRNGENWFPLPIREQQIKLEGDNEETRISFDVVSFSGTDIVCQYRLKGYENRWQDLSGKREIVLKHLPAGNYELELLVYIEGHEENPSQLSLMVNVPSLWWQSWWFITLLTLLLFILLYGLYKRLKRKKAVDTSIATNDSTTDNPVNPFMQQVMAVIEQNYTNPEFSVEDLAKELGASKSTLIRRLKPLTDLTPVELISIYRLKKADEMLRTQNKPVKEVSFLTGFSNPYYFSRKYKEYFGYPPSQQKRES